MPATCPVCATPVAPDAAYCHACGATQPARCPACGEPRGGSGTYCMECGAKLPDLLTTGTPLPASGGWPGAADAAPTGGPPGAAQPFAVPVGMPPSPAWHDAPAPAGVPGFAPGFGAALAGHLIAPVRQRPPWMAAALVVVTFGLYWLVWFGQSWSEMKRLVRDPAMSPFWHALTPLVPVYGLFRTHAHFRVLATLLTAAGLPVAVPPALAVVLALVAGLMNWIAYTASVGATEFVVLMLGAVALLARLVARGQASLNALWRAEFAGRSRSGAHWGEWLALVVCGLLFALVVVGALIG